MPTVIEAPVVIQPAGNKPKIIEEYVGGASTHEPRLSIAVMDSPPGWCEPGQRPQFDEYSVVLAGILRVEHEHGVINVPQGSAVHTRPGEWVRYSTPDGARYLAVCLPAFSPTTVHRDEEPS